MAARACRAVCVVTWTPSDKAMRSPPCPLVFIRTLAAPVSYVVLRTLAKESTRDVKYVPVKCLSICMASACLCLSAFFFCLRGFLCLLINDYWINAFVRDWLPDLTVVLALWWRLVVLSSFLLSTKCCAKRNVHACYVRTVCGECVAVEMSGYWNSSFCDVRYDFCPDDVVS